jgi:glycosyltransferase involved in cell wall biosynthesis
VKILLYDDNLGFGGHQVMACRGIEALAEDPSLDVSFLFNPGNQRLAEWISAIPNLKAMECPFASRRFQGMRNLFSLRRIQALKEKFREMNPDVLVCIQGDIEQSSMATLAARRGRIECISYIALTHRMSDKNATLGGLRDFSSRGLLNQPGRYIAISNSMKERLLARGVTRPVTVVPNGIPVPPSAEYGPRAALTTLGLFGRIEFKQKAQDFSVKAFGEYADTFRNCRLVIAGSGPDERRLRRLVAASPCRDRITVLPWQEDIESFYRQIDLLMIPSRYEGVPLVMLEALARGIPVIGSACDGMQDFLPASWTFHPGDAGDMARVFSGLRERWMKEIEAVSQQVREEMSLTAFKAAFHRAVTQAE